MLEHSQDFLRQRIHQKLFNAEGLCLLLTARGIPSRAWAARPLLRLVTSCSRIAHIARRKTAKITGALIDALLTTDLAAASGQTARVCSVFRYRVRQILFSILSSRLYAAGL